MIPQEATLALFEFSRVREWLASFASCEPARRLAEALAPAKELGEARRRLTALAQAKRLADTRGEWPSPPREDWTAVLEAARRGRRLEGKELAGCGALSRAIERSARYWKAAEAEFPVAAAPAGRDRKSVV